MILKIEKAILCAADHIEKEPENWCRDHYSFNGQHCAVGWISKCAGENEAEIEKELYEYLKEEGMSENTVIAFNDDEENDHIAVAKFLRGLVKK